MKNDTESDARAKEQIDAMIWSYTRDQDVKNEATGALDNLRTQVKMHQLRTSREKKDTDAMMADRTNFKEMIYSQTLAILDDLFPTDSLEYKLSALDLINICMRDEATTDETGIIEAKSLFHGREETLPSGKKVQFRALFGDIDQARKEWVQTGRDIVKEYAQAMMKKSTYRDTRNVALNEMKEAEMVNSGDLDDIRCLFDATTVIYSLIIFVHVYKKRFMNFITAQRSSAAEPLR